VTQPGPSDGEAVQRPPAPASDEDQWRPHEEQLRDEVAALVGASGVSAPPAAGGDPTSIEPAAPSPATTEAAAPFAPAPASTPTPSTFERTAPAGMTTVTGTPASRPAQAYACPALPAEIVIAPRSRSSDESEAMRESAARGLNEPVFWRFSAFRNRRSSATRRPVAARATRAAVVDDSRGVWWRRPARSSRVARIRSSVMSAVRVTRR